MIGVSLLGAAIISFWPQLVQLPEPKPVIGLLLALFAAYRWQAMQHRLRLLAASELEPVPSATAARKRASAKPVRKRG
jgi:hypothetical protein